MKIILVCAGGMSTSILAKNMQEYSNKLDLEYEISAISISKAKLDAKDADIVLCAPQVKFQVNTLKEQLPNVQIAVIDMIDYGMMNGQAVLDKTMELLKK